MAADSLSLQRVKQASQSFIFQRMLRLNPALARAAERNRDKLALEFMQAQGSGNGAPIYGGAVLSGYDPLRPPVDIAPLT